MSESFEIQTIGRIRRMPEAINWVAEYHKQGCGRGGHKYPLYFHTSHPQMCAALRRSPKWTQCSAVLYGGNKAKSAATIQNSRARHGKKGIGSGYGGHFRAVQGFKYVGEAE